MNYLHKLFLFKLLILSFIIQINFQNQILCTEAKEDAEAKQLEEENSYNHICRCCGAIYETEIISEECKMLREDNSNKLFDVIDLLNADHNEAAKETNVINLAIRATKILAVRCIRTLLTEINLETKKKIFKISRNMRNMIQDSIETHNNHFGWDSNRNRMTPNDITDLRIMERNLGLADTALTAIKRDLITEGLTEEELQELMKETSS